MKDNLDLEMYLSANVEKLVKDILRTSMPFERENKFLFKYSLAAKKAAKKRREAEDNGEHVPPFLIASITSVCNLHCKGCYARSLGGCCDGENDTGMSADEWRSVFSQAEEMGVGFILLAGGEPLARRDIITAAGEFQSILFPVFTNGTMISGEYLELFDKRRNLVPIISIEGDEAETDTRRGKGVYAKIENAMRSMTDRKLLFGASITVTAENIQEVTSDDFLQKLHGMGCRAVIYVEFVPVDDEVSPLALDDSMRDSLNERVRELRRNEYPMLVISFPGDEEGSGGCLAAGRGFFHINSSGGAEPCPFSPYSDISVREHTLKEVMQSALFRGIRENELLREQHVGGCALFQKRDEVEKILSESPVHNT